MDPIIIAIILVVLFALYIIFGFWSFWTALLINIPFLVFFGLRTFAVLRRAGREDYARYAVAAVLGLLVAVAFSPAMASLNIWPLTVLLVSAYLLYHLIRLLETLYSQHRKKKR